MKKGKNPSKSRSHRYSPPTGPAKPTAAWWGVPVWLKLVRDDVFNKMSQSEYANWQANLTAALPNHLVDWDQIRQRIFSRILREVAAPAIEYGTEPWRIACREAVERVAALQNTGDGPEWPQAHTAATVAASMALKAEPAKGAEAAWEAAEAATWATIESLVLVIRAATNAAACSTSTRNDAQALIRRIILDELQRKTQDD